MDAAEYRIETLDHCPNCGSAEFTPWLSSADVLLENSEERFVYARCQSCGVVFQQVRPTEDTVGFFYRGDYGPYALKKKKTPPYPKLHRRLLKLAAAITGEKRERARVNGVYAQHLSATCSVFLDFGCGGSSLMDDLKVKFGCETIGMDFDQDQVAAARGRGHRAYPASAEGWAQIENSSVDLVVMNHVLEHLYHPEDVLNEVLRVLKPGGGLMITVPNPDGYSAQTYGEDWYGLCSPRHIILFTPDSARQLVSKLGFEKSDVIGLSIAKDIVRSKARRTGLTFDWPLNMDGIQAIKVAFLAKREANKGGFDQFTLIARKPHYPKPTI